MCRHAFLTSVHYIIFFLISKICACIAGYRTCVYTIPDTTLLPPYRAASSALQAPEADGSAEDGPVLAGGYPAEDALVSAGGYPAADALVSAGGYPGAGAPVLADGHSAAGVPEGVSPALP